MTAEEASRSIMGEYFDAGAPDTNAAYFAKVRSHFYQIGLSVPENELRKYTASRYITSEPPSARVYVGTRFLGRTNDGALFFVPGQYTVTFSRGSASWSEILVFVAGRNASLAVRPR
jgi:hypothetical protein